MATFTQDLSTAFDKKFNPTVKSRIVAINDRPTSIYNYNSKVVDQIAATELEQYVKLAKRINKREEVKLINIQHEFGLFGGDWGDYLIPFLQALEKPAIITFHSILPNPDDYLKNVVRFIAEHAKAIVVMNNLSQDTLVQEYQIPRSKVHLIPHGIPQTTFEPSETVKAGLGFANRLVISTFGLLSPNKGIEYVIRALPAVIKNIPNVLYLILGATHPVVRREDGEAYRNFLIQEVNRLNLNDNVKFYDKYLTLEEIVNFLKASDIYVAPALDVNQSVSGTLSYAVGCGRPVISTASKYAQFLVDDRNGILVKPKNSKAVSEALLRILGDPKMMKAMATESYEKSRHMIWPNVAAAHFQLYQKFIPVESEENKLPPMKFDHLIRLTDDFGVLHFAKYSKPEKRYGYSADDNARALTVSAMHYQKNPGPEILNLIKTYLNFLEFVQRADGSFANIVSSQKRADKTADEDVQGRAIWALGYLMSLDNLPAEIKKQAEPIFRKALTGLENLKSPRAIAFAMTGLYHYLKNASTIKQWYEINLWYEFKKLADQQLNFYRSCATKDWEWFEDQLTYSNSILPESLFYAYDLTKNKKYLETAKKSLEFLGKITFESKHYSPIGQNGWYFRYKRRARFDQQPEDAAHMVQTKIAAYKITGEEHYLQNANKAFQWFLGKNHLSQVVYDEVTGGCSDGLGETAMNLNQGAESTISYLLARLAFEFVEPPTTSEKSS